MQGSLCSDGLKGLLPSQEKVLLVQRREIPERGLPLPFRFHSVTQPCLTLCDPTDCSTPGFPVHHQLPELAQTHVHRVGDAIQPSHPLSPSSPALSLSQHQVVNGITSVTPYFNTSEERTLLLIADGPLNLCLQRFGLCVPNSLSRSFPREQ